MKNKKFAAEFISFINETFEPGTIVTTALIKEALNHDPGHRVHKEYRKFLDPKGMRGWCWSLTDFDRVAKWMKWHPGYYKEKDGVYTICAGSELAKTRDRHRNLIYISF